jgi:hypothetical protein
MASVLNCFTCKTEITGRSVQIVECCTCSEIVHRACLPEKLSSTDYVRMKKYNEVFHFKCAVCFVPPAIPVGRKLKAKQPSSQVSEVPERTEPQRRNPTRVASTRPSTVVPSARPVERVASTRPCAMVLSAPVPRIVLTSTPMDEVLPNNPGTDPVPMESAIVDQIVDQSSIAVSVGGWSVLSLNFTILPKGF